MEWVLCVSGFGAEAANALGNYAIGQGNNMAGMYQQKGQIMAGKSAIPWQTAAQANYSVGKGFGDAFNLQSYLGAVSGNNQSGDSGVNRSWW